MQCETLFITRKWYSNRFRDNINGYYVLNSGKKFSVKEVKFDAVIIVICKKIAVGVIEFNDGDDST